MLLGCLVQRGVGSITESAVRALFWGRGSGNVALFCSSMHLPLGWHFCTSVGPFEFWDGDCASCGRGPCNPCASISISRILCYVVWWWQALEQASAGYGGRPSSRHPLVTVAGPRAGIRWLRWQALEQASAGYGGRPSSRHPLITGLQHGREFWCRFPGVPCLMRITGTTP